MLGLTDDGLQAVAKRMESVLAKVAKFEKFSSTSVSWFFVVILSGAVMCAISLVLSCMHK